MPANTLLLKTWRNITMNFAPSISTILKVKWSDEALKQIENIKKEFVFKPNYDLVSALGSSVNWHYQEQDVIRQEPSINNSKSALTQLYNMLNTTKSIPEFMFRLGTKNREMLIDILKEDKSIDHIRKIEINNEILLVDETLGILEDGLDKLTPTIARAASACEQAINKLPKSKPGKKSNSSLTKRFIPILTKIYEDGTGNKPKCEWDRESAEIFPDCDIHLFIIQIGHILKEEAGLDLGEDSSIEKYVKDNWRKYKTKNYFS